MTSVCKRNNASKPKNSFRGNSNHFIGKPVPGPTSNPYGAKLNIKPPLVRKSELETINESSTKNLPPPKFDKHGGWAQPHLPPSILHFY